MRYLRFLPLAMAVLALSLASCSDSTSPTESTNTTPKRELLTGKTWKTMVYTMNGVDLSSEVQHLTSFSDDGTYVATNSDGSTEPGVWEFAQNDTHIIMDKGTDIEIDWTVLELTATSLKLESSATFQGVTFKGHYEGVPE